MVWIKLKKTKRVSKAQWLEVGLEVLKHDGVTGVRIELLAKRLDISKSGFYWHFENREHLLKDMLAYWSSELTEIISGNRQMLAHDPKRRLARIAEMVFEYDLVDYDMSIRQWAVHDVLAARAVRKVDRIRTDFISKAFSELGFSGDELDMRSMLFVCYHTWESTMFRGISRKRRRELITRRIELLTGK